jgi:hypothetical protein
MQDSGKLQTLDVLLKRLRAQNHRVLLFAQMTKMLNILEVCFETVYFLDVFLILGIHENSGPCSHLFLVHLHHLVEL